MNRFYAACTGVVVALALLVAVGTTEDKKSGDAKLAAAQFEQLKKLAGEWTGKAGHGEGEGEASISYKVTGAGSTVMETVFPGTGHEMVTMYHLDGDALVLTHYCALGNQPRMKSEASSDPKKLDFKFLGGTNMDAAKDMHMHEATIEIVADDHIRAAWTAYVNGKPDHTGKFDWKRKK